jgi:hypothetical protein
MQAEAVETSLSSRIAELPENLREQIEACPAKGQGVTPQPKPLFKPNNTPSSVCFSRATAARGDISTRETTLV